MLDYLVPILLLLPMLLAFSQKQDGYAILIDGAGEGLQILKKIVPSLVILLTAVTAFQESGAAEVLSRALAPAFRFLGIPPECAMLVLVRPFSGSAALAVGSELMLRYGVDSAIGRTAAVMLGSTETTFYTISVYFGAAGIRKTRYTVPAALFADFVGFTAAALSVRIFFP